MIPSWLSADQATLMAIINVNTDSFSDPRHQIDLDERIRSAADAAASGAAIIDLGAQSAALAAELVPEDVQIAALVPVVEALVARSVPVSVDTYQAGVTLACINAGADVVNDYAGGHDDGVIAAVAASNAHYVLTHNPLGARRRQTDPDYYGDVVTDVCRWFDERLAELERCGIEPGRVILDPGVDVAKTPAQTLDLLRGADAFRERFEQAQLWALSRKDVLGAVTGRPPSQRDPATLALVSVLADQPRTLLRVHDVAGATDVLAVAAALAGRRDLDPGRLLDERLRREA